MRQKIEHDPELGPDMQIFDKVTLHKPIPCLEIVFDDGHIQAIYGKCLDKLLEAVK